MKKALKMIMIIILLGIIIFYKDNISNFIMVNFIYKRDIVVEQPNQYRKDLKVTYVHEVTDFEPKSKEDLTNILYTILNNGWKKFTFFCDTEYKSCITDVNNLIENRDLISNLNNFVNPYNSYNRLFVNYNNFGKVTIEVEKIYDDAKIAYVENRVTEIMAEIIKDNMTVEEKIKAFHDYIINTTTYDNENAEKLKANEELDDTTNTSNAYGLFTNHVSLCGGYSDAMAIFLNRIGVPNMKISNNTHVWNLAYLNGKWLHLDLTWDDPVVDTHENLLLHNYFLITNADLQQKDSQYHKFNTDIYVEAQ